MTVTAWKWTAIVSSGCALFLAFRPFGDAPTTRTVPGPGARPAIAAADESSLVDQLRAARTSGQACQIIARLDGAGGSAPLIEALDRTRLPELRRCATEALAHLDDPAAVARLSQLATDGDAEVRGKALVGLARSTDRSAAATVLQLTQEGPQSRRTEALVALASAGRPEATELLVHALDTADEASQQTLAEALGQTHDPSVVPALERLLTANGSRLRGSALRALGQVGDPASIAILERTLTDTEGDVRAAALALSTIEDPAARRALVRAAGSTDEDSSISALFALRGFDGDDIKAIMFSKLTANDRRAGMACDFFAAHPDPAASRRMIELARAGNWNVSRHAVLALKDTAGPETKALLTELAGHRGSGQLVAIEALRALPGGAEQVRPMLLRLAADGGDDAGSALMALADDDSPAARRAMLEALRGGGSASSTAAFALSRRHDPESLRALEQTALSSPRKLVRQEAVAALSSSKDPHAVETLERLVTDPDGGVRGLALSGLIRRGGPRAEALALQSASSKSSEDRQLAVSGLIQSGSPTALSRLRDLTADSDENVARLAFDGVLDKEPEQGKAMLQSLMQGDGKSRKRAIEVASSIDVDIARPMILEAVRDRDPEVVLLATQSIARVGGQEAQEAMVELLRAPGSSAALRKAAAISLEEMGGGGNEAYRDLIDRYRGHDDEDSEGEAEHKGG